MQGTKSARWRARSLLTELKPRLAISIERAGLTRDSKLYLNMRGVDISENTAKLDYLFQAVDRTVAIGDGGNEIGMGSVYDHIPEVSTLVPGPGCNARRAPDHRQRFELGRVWVGGVSFRPDGQRLAPDGGAGVQVG